MLRRSTWTLVMPAMRCIGVAIQATFCAGPLTAGPGDDRAIGTASCEVTVAGLAIGDDAAATVAVAPASAPMSHRLSHGRHPLDNCERVPKRATCRKPGSVTPAGSSRS